MLRLRRIYKISVGWSWALGWSLGCVYIAWSMGFLLLVFFISRFQFNRTSVAPRAFSELLTYL